MSNPSVPAQGPHLDPRADPRAPAEPTAGHPHLFVQAPVPALDVDGLTAVVLGVIAFALASIGLGMYQTRLDAAGHGWWLGVALSGLGLGLLGLAYCWRRRVRRHAGHLVS